MKDTGSYSTDSEMKKYPEVPYAGTDYKEDYLKATGSKADKDVKKVKRSMIKE
jgi:hypothetical protein